MNEIEPGLWLGSYTALSGQKSLRDNNITHILSLLGPEIPALEGQYVRQVKNFKHKRIDIDDIEDENIIQYFDRTNKFIHEALDSGGGILVHCMAGVSRSSTAVAAYLMKKYLWNPYKTIEFMRQKRPVVNPNSSFIEQLEVYFNIGFEISMDRPEYRQLLLQQQAESAKFLRSVSSVPALQQTEDGDKSSPEAANDDSFKPLLDNPTYVVLSRLTYKLFNHSKRWDQFDLFIATEEQGSEKTHELTLKDIPSEKLAYFSKDQSPKLLLRDRQAKRDILLTSRLLSNDNTSEIRCKKCRQVLTTSKFFFPHQEDKTKCSQYFSEPLSWMSTELEKGLLEGKLACPKCTAKVGSYHWQGSKCSCGKWVTPAIGFQKAKTDEMSSRPATATMFNTRAKA